MRLILVGPPGAGKGTQAVHLAAHFGVPHISTGDIFRTNIKGETELGKLAKSYMDVGNLVPDSVTNEMLKDRIGERDAAVGFLLLVQPPVTSQRFLWAVFAWGTITSVTYTALVLVVLHGGGWAARALSGAAFLRLATLGYGIYLVHVPLCERVVLPIAQGLLSWRTLPIPIVWAISVALLVAISAAVAYVLHLLIEKPALRLRDRIAP